MKSRLLIPLFIAWASLTTALNAQQTTAVDSALPVSESTSIHYYQSQSQPLTYAQQRARFEAEQRIYRIEWNNWIGYSPSRPTVNSSYMSGIAPRYYVPSRGVVYHPGQARHWYW